MTPTPLPTNPNPATLANGGVLLVLMHYARPDNMQKVLAAWRGQTRPPDKVVVVDNSPAPQPPCNPTGVELYPAPYLFLPGRGDGPYHTEAYGHYPGADDVWRFRENHGCPARWAPALMYYGYRWVLFADDDFLPGRKALAHLMGCAEALEYRFSVLGWAGRRFRLDAGPGKRYAYGDVPRAQITHCHNLVRCQFFQADRMVDAVRWRNKLLAYCALEEGWKDARGLCGTHDDLMLNLGIQHAYKWPSYVVNETADPEEKVIAVNLPDRQAVYRRSCHLTERNRMLDLCIAAGWNEVTP
jgi:hypothetical protein